MFRRLMSNLALVFAIVVAMALLAEWTVRLLWPQSLIHALVRYDPLLGVRGNPFGQASIIRADGRRHFIRLNAMGLRLHEELSQSRALSDLDVWRQLHVFGTPSN